MKEAHEILLYIAYNLYIQNQIISIDTLRQNLEWIQFEKFDVEKEVKWLELNGFLVCDNESRLLFTEVGKNEASRINEQRTKDEFSRKINRSTDSEAYLEFCEKLYGYRMYLFNMMDKEQLDYLFNSIVISKNDTILDLGCGTGNILNHLVNKFECRGVGIDQLDKTIITKNSRMISYIEGNIDSLPEYKILPDITLSIDSLYFSSDLDKLISNLKCFKNNRLYLYYSQYIFGESEKDRSILHCDNTRLARILQKNAIQYKTIDYSRNEHSLYENALKILPELKKAFEEEGNIDLYETKLNECIGGKDLYDNGLASRYLYIVE